MTSPRAALVLVRVHDQVVADYDEPVLTPREACETAYAPRRFPRDPG